VDEIQASKLSESFDFENLSPQIMQNDTFDFNETACSGPNVMM